jgi:hypothetical protein
LDSGQERILGGVKFKGTELAFYATTQRLLVVDFVKMMYGTPLGKEDFAKPMTVGDLLSSPY